MSGQDRSGQSFDPFCGPHPEDSPGAGPPVDSPRPALSLRIAEQRPGTVVARVSRCGASPVRLDSRLVSRCWVVAVHGRELQVGTVAARAALFKIWFGLGKRKEETRTCFCLRNSAAEGLHG